MINAYCIFNGAKFFIEDGPQIYLVFQSFVKYFKPIANIVIRRWKSKGWSDESIKPPATSNNSLNPRLDYYNNPKF